MSARCQRARELPPAYLHLVAMPMHMQLFVVEEFSGEGARPDSSAQYHSRAARRRRQRAPLRLTVHFDTMRLTDFGQEYDFTTRYEQNGAVVWEEVSTMFARGNTAPKEGGKRPAIERSTHPRAACRPKRSRSRTTPAGAMRACPATSIRFISRRAPRRCSASSRPSRTACGRSAAASPRRLRTCPRAACRSTRSSSCRSTFLRRRWRAPGTPATRVEISMCTMRGDRLHLAMQVRPL